MNLETSIDIQASVEQVWPTITDIAHCQQVISAIIDIKVLNTPEQGLIGLKWQETRLMFGKKATETMWITEAEKPLYYCTRAESHGSVYLTKMSLDSQGTKTRLIMNFSAYGQTLWVRLISRIMAPLLKKSLLKSLHQDLVDIKTFIEQQ